MEQQQIVDNEPGNTDIANVNVSGVTMKVSPSKETNTRVTTDSCKKFLNNMTSLDLENAGGVPPVEFLSLLNYL